MKRNFYSDLLDTISSATKDSPLGELINNFIVAANATLQARALNEEPEDNDNQENEKNTLGKYIAPDIKEISTSSSIVNFVAEEHISDLAYDENPVKADEFIKSHLDDTIFKIFSENDEMYKKPHKITSTFKFTDDNVFEFSWDWDKESFVLSRPILDEKPKYDQYKREFVPAEAEVSKTDGTFSEEAKVKYRDSLCDDIQNAPREEIADLLKPYVKVLKSLRPEDREELVEDMTLDVADGVVVDAVAKLLRNVTDDDIYILDGEIAGVVFTKEQFIEQLGNLGVDITKAAVNFSCDKVVDASQIFTETLCKTIAKTFRFSKVAFDGELKLVF